MADGTETVRRLSHSTIETLTQCGMRYRLEKIERVPRAPASALILGVAVHEAIEAYGRSVMAGTPLDGLAVEVTFINAFDHELQRADPHGCIEHDEASLLVARGQAAIQAFLDALGPVYRPVAVEESFDGAIPGLDGWRFTGRIDARTNARQPDGSTKRTIVDMKCIAKPWPTGTEHSKSQVEAYYWGSTLSGRELPEQMTFVTLISQAPAGWQVGDPIEARLDIRTTHRQPEHVAAYQDMARHKAEVIQAGHFEPNPSPLCAWCSVLSSCAVGKSWLRSRGRTPQPEIARFIERGSGK